VVLAARGGTRVRLRAGICGRWQGVADERDAVPSCRRPNAVGVSKPPRPKRLGRRGAVCGVALAQRWTQHRHRSRALHTAPRRSQRSPRACFHHASGWSDIATTVPKRPCFHLRARRVGRARRHASPYRGTPPGDGGSGSFDFLGFTHVWARSRKGNWVIRQQTAKDRLRRVIQRCGAPVRHRAAGAGPGRYSSRPWAAHGRLLT
jgi:hypothetical protein